MDFGTVPNRALLMGTQTCYGAIDKTLFGWDSCLSPNYFVLVSPRGPACFW